MCHLNVYEIANLLELLTQHEFNAKAIRKPQCTDQISWQTAGILLTFCSLSYQFIKKRN